ncbi:MAG: peptidase MA family metallohydrolase [Gemmatimonadota bacterium]|nr:peptidase MA family metallohydrolase [Gemmatimonadota bacterium]
MRPYLTAALSLLTLSAPLAGAAQPDSTAGWRRLEGRRAIARYRGSDSLRARRALQILDAMPPLRGLGDVSIRPLVTIAADKDEMDALVGSRVPEWGAAVALSDRMEMILPGRRLWPSTPVEEARILRHEWAHLALAHAMGDLRIPRWFNEGYAEWAAGGWLGGGGWRLSVALALDQAPSLDSLTIGWPAGREHAEVSYLLSASVIEYLVRSSGERGLERFFDEWRRVRSFDDALRSVFGATAGQLESDWRKWARRRYGWLMVVSHSTVFWAILSVGLIAMVWIRRRHRREQMARLRAGEPPDAPVFWTPPIEGEHGWQDPGR